jgi:PKD repeat protein
VLALLLGVVLSIGVFAAPTFTDQDINNGYVNPKDTVVVQKIKIVASGTSTINSIFIRNLGTADETDIVKIVIGDDEAPFASPLEEYASLADIRTGRHFALSCDVPNGTSYLWIGVELEDKDTARAGKTIQFEVYFYAGTYTAGPITDGSGEEIFKGGFEKKEDDSPSASYLNPGDPNVLVQEATFTDDDGNDSTVGIDKVSVSNLNDADHDDVDDVHVTIKGKVVGVENTYTAAKTPIAADWGSGNPIEFAKTDFTPNLPAAFDDDEAVIVEIEVTVGGTTDKHQVQTEVTLDTQENDGPYEQTQRASTTHTIRKQGFEATSEISDEVASGVKSPKEKLVQKVTATDDDVNDHEVVANGIWIKNEGTATKDDIEQIVVKRTDTSATLLTIPTASIQDFDTGHLYTFTTNRTVTDDHSATFAIYYTVADGITAGRTLKPVVKIQGKEPTTGTNYESDEASYPDYIALYPHGLETVSNVTPPTGGTAYSGQRVLIQKIRCVDEDENNDNVHINPVRPENVATNPVTPTEITKIEVRTADDRLLGEETNLASLNTGGVPISTLQNNVVSDGNSEIVLCIYVTFAGPEVVTAGHKLKFETTVFSEENGHSGEQTVTSAEWILAINHRPTCDFDYTPSTDPTYETEITFTAKDVNDEDGDDIVAHRWEFSDGGTGTGTSVKHTFAAGGTVWAKLTVEDARGLTGSKQKTFDVEAPPVVPVAQFTWDPNTPGVGDEVEFTNTSTTPTGTTITGWDWDFGDDEDSDEQNPKHTYSAGGTYTVSLTVTNSDAQTNTVTHDIEVSALIPTANFDYSPATPDVGDTVTFTDKSTAADPATIGTWAWNFGDGNTSAVQNPTHSYTTMGTYTVSLTVTDNNEETSNAYTEQIVVGPPVMMYSYPNPTSNAATIVYRVPEGATEPVLRIYNITGALVFEQELIVDASPYTWDLNSTGGTAQPNGLYLCVVVAKANGSTIKSPTFKLLIQR